MRPNRLIALSAVALLALAGCGNDADPFEETDEGAAPTVGGAELAIGSANFPENALLAQIYAAALEDAGIQVSTTLNIGSRETYYAGLQDGSIDLVPEYTGGLATYLNPETTASERDDVLAEVVDLLPEGLQVLEISDAENKDAVVVTGQLAEELELVEIGDLVEHAGDLTLGGPPEFQTRPNGVDGLASVYGLEFGSFRSLSAGANLTVQSLINGQVDAANIFTTDPAIEENGFVVLEDPEALFAAQNVVPLISTDALTDEIEQVLNQVSAALTTENLTELNVQVMSEGRDPGEVARDFVDANL